MINLRISDGIFFNYIENMLIYINTLLSRFVSWFGKTLISSRKGIEDVVISMTPKAVSLIAGLITSVLIARGLGPDGMGNYALIVSVSGLAAGLSDLGIGQTAIRFASRAIGQGNTLLQHAVLRWAFRLRMSLILLLTAIIFIAAPWLSREIWHAENLTFLVRLSLLTGIFGAIAAVPTIYFLSMKRFRTNAAISVGQKVIVLLGIFFIATLNSWSVELVITVSLIATGFSALIFLNLVPRSIFFERINKYNTLKDKIKNIWKVPTQVDNNAILDSGVNSFAFFMMISSIAVMFTMMADVWLMGYFLEKNQIGIYSVASRVTLPLVMILGGLNTALWPRASALTSPQKTIDLLRKTFQISIIIAFVGVIYAIFVPYLIPILFGSVYESGILLGQLLSIRYCISILLCPIGVIGYSFGMIRMYWWINILQFIAVVSINILLLPKIGPMGSVLALIANEIIGVVFVGFIIRQKIIAMK